MGEGAELSPEISYVVIAYNEQSAILGCLERITGQASTATFEIIVVDDGSEDCTSETVAEYASTWPQVHLTRHASNLGRGAARHTGLRLARGDLIAMVDADVILPLDWLKRCQRYIDSGVADAVGGIPVPDGDVTFISNRFRLTPKPIPPTVPVSGTNGLYRRAVVDLLEVDPDLREGEDVAFNRAMESAGFRTRNLGDVVVEHRERKGFMQSLRWLFQSGQGATRQYIVYRELRAPDVAFCGLVAAIVLSGLGIGARPSGLSRASWGVPCAYLFTVSGVHLIRKFEIWPTPFRFGLAVTAYTPLIGAYFAGRMVGIFKALCRVPQMNANSSFRRSDAI